MIKFLDIQRITASFEPELSSEVQRVISSGWYLLGEEVATFEKAFAEYCDSTHCVGVANGLDALTLILMAWREMYGWCEGDEVIVPANTYIASILAISRAGLTPVLCEPNEEDALIDVSEMESLITLRTRAIMPVHLYGQVCEMDAVRSFARQQGLKVVEDCAQAHGALYKGTRVGALGDAAAFSFYPGKNLGALGDGGAVTTNDENLYCRLLRLRAHGITRNMDEMNNPCDDPWYYEQVELGYNYRMSNIQAAVGVAQLEKIEEHLQRKQKMGKRYQELFHYV